MQLVRYVGPVAALSRAIGLYDAPRLTIAGRTREVAPDDVEPAEIEVTPPGYVCDSWSHALDILAMQCGQCVVAEPSPAGLAIVVSDRRYKVIVR